MTFRLPFLCAFLLFLAGCSTTLVRESPAPVRAGDAVVETTALVEALRAWKGTRVQALNGSWKDRAFQAQCVMKGDGETLTVVFLAPQMRLMTITLSPPHIVGCERAPQIPDAFEPEFALFDLALVNLDAETLRRTLGDGLSVVDDGTTRRVCTKNGVDVAEIVRAPDGGVRFRQLVHGYEYEIRQVQ